MVQRIDGDKYNDNQLTELKIPLNLPYYSSSNNYNRIDGEIEIGGIQYNYVKKKVFNDTLFLLCLPNLDKTQLYKDKAKYAAKANDLPRNDKDNNAKKINSASEYDEYVTSYGLNLRVVTILVSFHAYNISSVQGYTTNQLRPPRLCC